MSTPLARRLVAAATAVALTTAAIPAAHAGDQKVVDKGIGFLASIRSQAKHGSCRTILKEFHDRNISFESEELFWEGVERDAQSRRDWIDKTSGGMTDEQKAQLEEELQKTRPSAMIAAKRCHGFELYQKRQAEKAAKEKAAAEGSTSEEVVTEVETETSVTTPGVNPVTGQPNGKKNDRSVTETLLEKVTELQTVNAAGGQQQAQRQAAAPKVTVYTQLLIPNPFDATKPFVVVIPPFIPQNMIAPMAHSLPAGWVLK